MFTFIFAFLDTPASTRQLAGLSEVDVREAVVAFERGDDKPARRLITDEVLAQLALIGSPDDIGRQLAALVRTHRPSSIGVCIRTGESLRRRVADTKAVFVAMAKELSS